MSLAFDSLDEDSDYDPGRNEENDDFGDDVVDKLDTDDKKLVTESLLPSPENVTLKGARRFRLVPPTRYRLVLVRDDNSAKSRMRFIICNNGDYIETGKEDEFIICNNGAYIETDKKNGENRELTKEELEQLGTDHDCNCMTCERLAKSLVYKNIVAKRPIGKVALSGATTGGNKTLSGRVTKPRAKNTRSGKAFSNFQGEGRILG